MRVTLVRSDKLNCTSLKRQHLFNVHTNKGAIFYSIFGGNESVQSVMFIRNSFYWLDTKCWFHKRRNKIDLQMNKPYATLESFFVSTCISRRLLRGLSTPGRRHLWFRALWREQLWALRDGQFLDRGRWDLPGSISKIPLIQQSKTKPNMNSLRQRV